MNKDIWIWTELLAFDNESPDLGVGEYLGKLEEVPAGFTILVSSIDFVLQHENWDEAHCFPADICSRSGHAGNGIRERQNWNSTQLKQLVAILHGHGCKVVFSFFCGYMNNAFHHEWVSDHPECLSGWNTGGVNLIARMEDGTLLEDLLVRKLIEVEEYYGFDGWHGPDGCGPGWSIFKGYHGNAFVGHFQEWLGCERFPEKFRGDMPDENQGKERLAWIWENLRDEWIDFFAMRWETFWKKAVDALHRSGRIAIINSPDTKSVFGGLYYLGIDYRKMAKIGVDMIVMEAASVSFSLGRGKRDYMTEFAAVMQEMAVAMPGVKICLMPCIKDACESYDALEHFRPMYERDYHFYVSRSILKNGALRRTAEAFLVCLGDYITAPEWKWLEQLFEASDSFLPAKSGELVWLHDAGTYAALRAEYRTKGTPEACYQIARLEEIGCLDISTIAEAKELPCIDSPMVVPNFHLLDKDTRQAILAKRQLLVLLGDLRPNVDYPFDSITVSIPTNTGVTFTCAILNSGLPAERTMLKQESRAPLNTNPEIWNPYADLPPAMELPLSFWTICGKKIGRALGEPPMEKGGPTLGIYGSKAPEENEVSYFRQWDGDGRQRIGIYSRVFTYRVPKYHLPEDAKVTPRTSFPRSKLQVKKGLIVSSDIRCKPLNIPPCGIVVIDVE